MKKTYKNSIQKKMVLIIAFVCIVTIGAFVFLSNVFLRNLYIRSKTDGMLSAFSSLNDAASDGGLYSESFRNEFDRVSSKNNIEIIVMTANGTVILSSQTEIERMMAQLYRVLFSQDDEKDSILYSGSNYSIELFHDDNIDATELILWGTLSDGNLILMQTGLHQIEESALVTTRFMIFTGLLAIIISIVLAVYLGRRISRPITELTRLSKKMSALDFDAKYIPQKDPNEVDELGVNMNVMSDTLQKTIIELKQANVELANDIKTLEENDRRRRAFLSDVSHELKTPIALIQGYAEGITDGITEEPEEIKSYADVIDDEAKHMDRIIRTLTALDNIEEGRQKVSMSRFDLAALISQVIENNRLLTESSGVKIDFSAEEPFWVISDESFAEQIVTNYFQNALHFVHGKNDNDPGTVSVSLERREDCVHSEIMNTGDPIPEEHLPHLFEKFYKADKARTREYGGSGIGLSIVKAMMDRLGRSFGAENRPEGVVFWFELDRG